MRRLRESQPSGNRWLSYVDRWGLRRPQIVLAASAVVAALALLIPGTALSAIVLAVAVLIGPAVVLVNILGFDGHASRWAVGLGTALSTLVIWALAVQLVRVLSDWRIHTALALAMLFGGLGALWFVVGRRVIAETELGERAAATWDRCTRLVQRRRPADRHERRVEDRGRQASSSRAIDQDRDLGHDRSIADALGPYSVDQRSGPVNRPSSDTRPSRDPRPSPDARNSPDTRQGRGKGSSAEDSDGESGLDWLHEAYGW